jgi:hypothetical protein
VIYRLRRGAPQGEESKRRDQGNYTQPHVHLEFGATSLSYNAKRFQPKTSADQLQTSLAHD